MTDSSMLKILLRNCIKGLTSIKLDLTKPVNMDSVTFCQIISTNTCVEKLEENGRTVRNALDASIRCRQKHRKKKWMLKISIDHWGNEYKKGDTHVLVDNKFPPLPRKHCRVLVEQFIKIIVLLLQITFSLYWNTISIIIYKMSLNFVKWLFWEWIRITFKR